MFSDKLKNLLTDRASPAIVDSRKPRARLGLRPPADYDIGRKTMAVILRDLEHVSDQIVPLGSRDIRMYLIRGQSYALLGGGVPWIVPRLEAQLEKHAVDAGLIRYLVVSHVHHDHCGAVPYLLRRYPHIQVVASEYGAHLLAKDRAVELMRSVNRKMLEKMKLPNHHNGISLDCEPVATSVRAGDGVHIDLGRGLTLQFYATPGHTRCSLSTYIPALEALFPADALPFPAGGNDKLIVTANHDYDDYIRSLEKLLPLSIKLIGYEHGGMITDEDAATMISRSLSVTLEQRQRIRERFEELNDLDMLVDEITRRYRALDFFSMAPFDLIRATISRMVRSALGMI